MKKITRLYLDIINFLTYGEDSILESINSDISKNHLNLGISRQDLEIAQRFYDEKEDLENLYDDFGDEYVNGIIASFTARAFAHLSEARDMLSRKVYRDLRDMMRTPSSHMFYWVKTRKKHADGSGVVVLYVDDLRHFEGHLENLSGGLDDPHSDGFVGPLVKVNHDIGYFYY